MILPHSKESKSHEEIQTIGGVVYATFKDAFYSMGLLDVDREYVDGIMESSFWAPAHYARKLFAILLMSSSMNCPENVFNKTWECMSDDILSRQRHIMKRSGINCIS